MLKQRKVLLLVLFIAVAVALFIAKKHSAGSAVTAPAIPLTPTAAVLEFLPTDVVTVAPGEIRQLLNLTGALRAYNQAPVKARVAGEVRDVLVREGESVSAGQVLIRMETSDYEARVTQAEGALAAAQGQLEIARQTRDNNQALLAKNFISKNAYDNAMNQYAIAVANVDSARGALAVTRKALADTLIRAPIAGLISSRNVQPGEKVSPDNRLLDVVDLSIMELEAAVPTSDIAKIRSGQNVQVKIEGIPAQIEAKVFRINPATSSGTRSVMAYVQIANTDLQLRAGMFAQAQLEVSKKESALMIPAAAVQYDAGKAYVYAIENNVVQQKMITPGLQGDNHGIPVVEVLSGLTAGSQIVKTNLGSMRSGIPVKFAVTKG
ncbi:efflux RND transporter periplasmic adaptor subunit [Undibacterium sp. WLX3042]|uniref:efflux RND transporter periplasmic adaptor subunit n=1 Tax=Undibacterium sp. WLX3042 TaxID=3412686 RepID=UPI003C2D1790